MIIRRATVTDAADICAITNPIIRETTITFTTIERDTPTVAQQIRTSGEAFQVAELDGKVIGFASLGKFRSGPGYAFVQEHSVQLAPSARGRGVGRALMQRIEQIARDQNTHVLVAGISGTNQVAMDFHAAIGFEKVGHMPQVGYKFGKWLDLILMQKFLPPGPDGAPDMGSTAG